MTENLINDALINSLTHEQVDEIADQLMYNAVSIPFVFVQITGSWSAAALLGQIRWWTRKLKRSFYKTNEEFCSDLHMGINEFKAAKKRLIELGLIKTEVKGTPPKTYYFYDNSLVHRRIIELAENQPINRMASNSIGWNSTNQLAENQPITTYSTNINITPNKLKLICPLQGDDTPRDVAFDDEEDILDNSGELAKSHQSDPKIKHNIYYAFSQIVLGFLLALGLGLTKTIEK